MSWGAKTLAASICGPKTGEEDSSSENSGTKLKFSGCFPQVKCQSIFEKKFSTNVVFRPNLAKIWEILVTCYHQQCQKNPQFRPNLGQICIKNSHFFLMAVMNPFYSQNIVGCHGPFWHFCVYFGQSTQQTPKLAYCCCKASKGDFR